MGYYFGGYKNDAPDHRGWIVGTFMEDGPRKTNQVEVKYWEFPIGKNEHPPKVSETIECTMILTGSCEAIIDAESRTLKAGDYIVIDPGTPNNLVMDILEPTTGITIKAPSDPSAKKVLEEA